MVDLTAVVLALLLLAGLPILGLVGRSRLAAVGREVVPEPVPIRRPALRAPPPAPAQEGLNRGVLRWEADGPNAWRAGPYHIKHLAGTWVCYGTVDKVLVPLGRYDSLADAQARAEEIYKQETA